MATTTTAKLGTCYWAGHTIHAATAAEQVAHCPTCEPVTLNGWTQRSGIKWATVRATVTDTKCDSACTSAKKAKCSCECGGANHGIAHGLAVR